MIIQVNGNDSMILKHPVNLGVNDYAKFSSTGLIGMTYNEVKIDLNLDNVNNVIKEHHNVY